MPPNAAKPAPAKIVLAMKSRRPDPADSGFSDLTISLFSFIYIPFLSSQFVPSSPVTAPVERQRHDLVSGRGFRDSAVALAPWRRQRTRAHFRESVERELRQVQSRGCFSLVEDRVNASGDSSLLRPGQAARVRIVAGRQARRGAQFGRGLGRQFEAQTVPRVQPPLPRGEREVESVNLPGF